MEESEAVKGSEYEDDGSEPRRQDFIEPPRTFKHGCDHEPWSFQKAEEITTQHLST